MNDKPLEKQIETILKQLLTNNPNINLASVVSVEGLPIVSIIPKNVDESHISAMTATLLTLGERATVEMKKGYLNEIIVKAKEGYIIVISAGMNAVLVITTNNRCKLGLILFECKKDCKKIEDLLK